MKKIAQEDKARFEWWIQTKFSVLPTDPRFLDLTEEQLELMHQHFLLDNPSRQPDNKGRDSEYDNYEKETPTGEPAEEGRLPIKDFESYSDPDFEKAWEEMDEEQDTTSIDENASENEFLDLDSGGGLDENESIDTYNNGWEEV